MKIMYLSFANAKIEASFGSISQKHASIKNDVGTNKYEVIQTEIEFHLSFDKKTQKQQNMFILIYLIKFSVTR